MDRPPYDEQPRRGRLDTINFDVPPRADPYADENGTPRAVTDAQAETDATASGSTAMFWVGRIALLGLGIGGLFLVDWLIGQLNRQLGTGRMFAILEWGFIALVGLAIWQYHRIDSLRSRLTTVVEQLDSREVPEHEHGYAELGHEHVSSLTYNQERVLSMLGGAFPTERDLRRFIDQVRRLSGDDDMGMGVDPTPTDDPPPAGPLGDPGGNTPRPAPRDPDDEGGRLVPLP
jgi:hypothetical protein